jgi:hypothetical protein
VNASQWPHLRRPAGRHRGVPSLAASLPQPSGQPVATATATLAGPEAPAGPDRIVVCGFCHVSGLSSQIPELAGLRRCGDIDGCVQRSLQEGRPRPLLSAEELVAAVPAEMLDPLPVAEPEPQTDAEADAAQFSATERLARWAPGETLSEDEEPAEAAAEPSADPCPIEVHLPGPDRFPCRLERGHEGPHPYGGREPWPDEGGPELTDACQRGDHEECNDPVECACGHHEQDAAEAARDLAVFLGPEEKGFGEPEPAPPVAAEVPAPDGGEGE